MLRALVMWAGVALSVSSCGAPTASSGQVGEPAPSTAEHPIDTTASTPEPTTPKGALQVIAMLVDAGDIEGIRALILDIRAPDGRSTADALIEGIREQRPSGDYAFSRASLDAAIERAGSFHRPDDRMRARFLRTFGEANPQLREGTGYWMFEEEDAHILMYELDGEVRLLFWEGLTRLDGEPRPPTAVRSTAP